MSCLVKATLVLAVAVAVQPGTSVAGDAGAAIARLARDAANKTNTRRPSRNAEAVIQNASLHMKTIEFNLALSTQWMDATANASAISKVVVNASSSYVPEYRQCGQIMNYAWREAHEHPCTEPAFQAADQMRDAVPRCSQLRQGEAYKRSYRELLDDQDAWCGKPACVPRCVYEYDCKRDFYFPHEPKCYGAGVDPCNKTHVHSQPDAASEGGITTDARSRGDVGRYEERKVKPWFMKHGTLGGEPPSTTTKPTYSRSSAGHLAGVLALALGSLLV